MGAVWKQRIISAAGKHRFGFFLFFLFLLTVDWTLFSTFSFLEREDTVLSQHGFGIVPKAQSVLHCHCVFKLFKIKTVLWGMKKSEMSWGHSGRLWDVHIVGPWSLANHQWGMKFCWQAYGWAYKQILPQLSLQITAVPSQPLNCNLMRDHPEFLTQKLWDDKCLLLQLLSLRVICYAGVDKNTGLFLFLLFLVVLIFPLGERDEGKFQLTSQQDLVLYHFKRWNCGKLGIKKEGASMEAWGKSLLSKELSVFPSLSERISIHGLLESSNFLYRSFEYAATANANCGWCLMYKPDRAIEMVSWLQQR